MSEDKTIRPEEHLANQHAVISDALHGKGFESHSDAAKFLHALAEGATRALNEYVDRHHAAGAMNELDAFQEHAANLEEWPVMMHPQKGVTTLQRSTLNKLKLNAETIFKEAPTNHARKGMHVAAKNILKHIVRLRDPLSRRASLYEKYALLLPELERKFTPGHLEKLFTKNQIRELDLTLGSRLNPVLLWFWISWKIFLKYTPADPLVKPLFPHPVVGADLAEYTDEKQDAVRRNFWRAFIVQLKVNIVKDYLRADRPGEPITAPGAQGIDESAEMYFKAVLKGNLEDPVK